jgi:hypothetical protein
MFKSGLSRGLAIFGALTALTGATCRADTTNPYLLQSFELNDEPHFSNYNLVVGRYLRLHGNLKPAKACVIGVTVDGRNDSAWVIWQGGGRLILWEGEDDLDRSRRNLSLHEDVVADDDAVGGSTYLVSRPWVVALESLCIRSGRYVTLN